MKKRFTRRKFLESGLKGSMAVGSAALTGFPKASSATVQQGQPSRAEFDSGQRELMGAVMDEIIPAGDGMPAASAAGGVDYLVRLARENPGIRKELLKSLSALANLSRESFQKTFTSLSHADRVKVLAQMEKKSPPDAFITLRDYVYEAYYTQPKVWKLIGYDFYATNESGPRMQPFDDSVLAQVRKRPRLYREAK